MTMPDYREAINIMTVPDYELEVHRKVYNNKHHDETIYVRPDSDGLQLVEVGIQDDKVHYLLINPEQALLVAKAIEDCAREILNGK